MSGSTKEKIVVCNNAGKKTPAATAPTANAYANATVLEKIKNLALTFRHQKCNETSSRFLFLNIKGNDKSYQTPKRKSTRLGRYVATKLKPRSVATYTARLRRSDRAPAKLGRYVATEHAHSSVATKSVNRPRSEYIRSPRREA
ncbi:hypothetical protein F2Q68_00017276 [Brassica cretica]|uniref:Uncharacterized protein n=1 Tax=Brassica cretica TaxID=69181 RepID=A0A8S9HS33_BRACR|nr:hypothetical protein F2Q68_00017276 [Brassica cretica]